MLKQAFPTKDEYFHELCETPVMSWPALVFFLAGVSILFFASYAALNGLIASAGQHFLMALRCIFFSQLCTTRCMVTWPKTVD